MQRIKIANDLLVSDGLSQCIDNCYLLITGINEQLKSIKNAKQNAHILVRNYATEMASEAAASRPFGISLSFQEILCLANNELLISHEIHAKNYFLKYAKDFGFPVNIHEDVIAERLGSTYHDFNLRETYIKKCKELFTVRGLVNYLATVYRYEILNIFANFGKTFVEKQDYIFNKLNNLGFDVNFNFHEVFQEKTGRIIVKAEESF